MSSKLRARALGTTLVVAVLAGAPLVAPQPVHADSFCAPEHPQTCLVPVQNSVHQTVGSTTATAFNQDQAAQSSADQAEEPYDPTVNQVDPTAKLSGVVGWTGYVAATTGGVSVPGPVTTPGNTATHTIFSSAQTSVALRSIALRDDYYNDTGSCSGYADQPEGAYDSGNGTLYASASGYIQCDFEDGYQPYIYVSLQLTGEGPYRFTNSGSSRSCNPANYCQVTDFRYFNLDCGQRGTYDHWAYLSGYYIDEAGYDQQLTYESAHNRGRYWRDC